MTLVCFVRHGQTDWNAAGRMQGWEDSRLTKLGLEQAERCAEHLAADRWDALVSSPLLRARETARIIAGRTGHTEVVEMPSFAERNAGEGAGLTPEEAAQRFSSGGIPGRENDETLKRRVMEGLGELESRFENKRVLVVCHGGVINALLSELSNGEHGLGRTKVENTSITTIQRENGQWKLIQVNQTPHLERPAPHGAAGSGKTQ